jgi:1,4-dihydroxy-2-naphthoyl-CoA hydrolase
MSTPDASEMINTWHQGTWAGGLGLVLTTATPERVVGNVSVRSDHCQPQGIVHGGVYASIVESLASVGAALAAQVHGKNVVGLENQTSFVRAVRSGTLHGTATPVTRGRRSQLWEVVIRNEAQAIVATGRVRLLVLDPEAKVGGSELAGVGE